MSELLDGVKVGDKLVCMRSYGSDMNVCEVTRLTATLVVCGTRSFSKRDGKMRGTSGWNARFARVPNGDDLARITLQNRIRRAQASVQSIKITAEILAAAETFLSAAQKSATKEK